MSALTQALVDAGFSARRADAIETALGLAITTIVSFARVLAGSSTPVPFDETGTLNAQVQSNGTDPTAGYSGSRFSNDGNPARVSLLKSRGATIGTHTAVQSGDLIGELRFSASDGANFRQAAQILAAVDGTPGSSDMPGRLVFQTTPDGSATPTERMRIDSNGFPIFLPASATPPTLGTNGQITLTLTSNTNLRISARGSDGTTRVANITLA